MGMARFLITLSVFPSGAATVSQEIQRSDRDRAILYAETWLARSRRSGYYFTRWYNIWSVTELVKDETAIPFANGLAKDTEEERLSGATIKPKAKKARKKATQKATADSDPWIQGRPSINRRQSQKDYLPIHKLGKPALRPSSTRERIAVMRAEAKRKLAANGVILPMGSNQNSQSQNRNLGGIPTI